MVYNKITVVARLDRQQNGSVADDVSHIRELTFSPVDDMPHTVCFLISDTLNAF